MGAESLKDFARRHIAGAFHQEVERLEHLAMRQMAVVWFSLSTVKRRKIYIIYGVSDNFQTIIVKLYKLSPWIFMRLRPRGGGSHPHCPPTFISTNINVL